MDTSVAGWWPQQPWKKSIPIIIIITITISIIIVITIISIGITIPRSLSPI
jgi:hypothetical protein